MSKISSQNIAGLSGLLRSEYEKFNACFEAAYKGRNYQERDEYRDVIKAAKELAHKPETSRPETYALVAYMLLMASRLRAIINNVARVPNLKNQNRMLWDKPMIKEGLSYINKSAGGSQVTEYHLRAGICACHALAKNYESTDWKQIISLYDQYLEINDSIEIALERVQVISEAKGPESALEAVLQIDTKEDLTRIKAINLSLAELYKTLGDFEQAIGHFTKCYGLSRNERDRSLYINKIEFCRQQLQLSKKYDQALSF